MSTVTVWESASVVPGLRTALTRSLARGVVVAIRLSATLAAWVALGIGAGVAIVTTAPKFLGGQSLTVMSGSMEPTIRTGDVIISERIAPLEARVGDIVTFRSPDRSGRLLTHRVREIEAQGGKVYFETKGDAVNSLEHWGVAANGTLGRTKYRISKLGYALFYLRQPFGRVALLGLPLLAFLAYGLVRIWRPSRGAGPARPSAPHDPLAIEPVREVELAPAERDVAVDSTGRVTPASVEPAAQGPRLQISDVAPRRLEPGWPHLVLPVLLIGGYVLLRRRRPTWSLSR